MKADVQRVDRVQITRIEGTYSLVQRFWFSGLDVAAVTDILMSAPLVGKNSLFGNRPGREVPAPDGQRTLQGFSPAPAFEFDVHLQSTDQGVILARFSQPGNQRPYLSGELVWLLADLHNGRLFCEEINTTSASEKGCRPLAGCCKG